jgi:hypothetical protein
MYSFIVMETRSPKLLPLAEMEVLEGHALIVDPKREPVSCPFWLLIAASFGVPSSQHFSLCLDLHTTSG